MWSKDSAAWAAAPPPWLKSNPESQLLQLGLQAWLLLSSIFLLTGVEKEISTRPNYPMLQKTTGRAWRSCCPDPRVTLGYLLGNPGLTIGEGFL